MGNLLPKEPQMKFKDGLLSCELDRACWDEFSNDGVGRYTTYPPLGAAIVRKVRLIEDRIPAEAVLFQPKFWPGHWIVDGAFAQALENVCQGGFSGYYFWTLDLDDISKSHMDTMRALR